MYFAALEMNESFGENLCARKNGMGMNNPMKMANAINQYSLPMVNSSLPRAPMAIELELYCWTIHPLHYTSNISAGSTRKVMVIIRTIRVPVGS